MIRGEVGFFSWWNHSRRQGNGPFGPSRRGTEAGAGRNDEKGTTDGINGKRVVNFGAGGEDVSEEVTGTLAIDNGRNDMEQR